MKRFVFLPAIFTIAMFYHAAAQHNDTAQLILSDAKDIPDQKRKANSTLHDNSTLRATPALHTLSNSKQTPNTRLPVDAVALPPKNTVVPGHKK